MTEFELLSLFNEFFDATFARLNDFMAGTFAMLITAYFASAKLNRKMTALVVLLYTLFAIATIIPVLMATGRFVRTAGQLKVASTRPDSIIGDLFPMFPSEALVMPTMAILLLGAFAGTLVFFFQARKSKAPGFNL
jgi:hypothetical protein